MTLIPLEGWKFLSNEKWYFYDYEHPFFPETTGLRLKLTPEALKRPELVAEYERYVGILLHGKVKLSKDGSELKFIDEGWN